MRRNKYHGSITALFPFETLQIDIFSLFNFVNDWRHSPSKYAFCAIDIFTLTAFGIAMTKTMYTTTEAFRTILEEINSKEDDKDDKEQDSPYLPT